MKIRMTQPEIGAILLAHILNTVSLKTDAVPTIDFTATRGDEGIVAEVDIPYMGLSGLAGVAANTDTSLDKVVTDKAAPKPRAPRTTATAPSTVDKGNLFAGLTQPATVPEDAAPAGSEAEGNAAAMASIEAAEAMAISDAAEDAPFEVPAADGPKSLFAQ